MASVVDSVPHTVRTAKDPRQSDLYDVTVSRIDQVNPRIRLLRLSLSRNGPPFRHLPGQWLDVHIPSLPQAGGFTITSPPSTAITNKPPRTNQYAPPPPPTASHPDASLPSNLDPYIELAIQTSSNPPAAYLSRPTTTLLHTPLRVRIGGRFVYPPPDLSYEECTRLERVVFIAGGVGVNPIMSMVSAMHGLGAGKVGGMPRVVRVLYTTRYREGEEVLFYERLKGVAELYSKNTGVDFKFLMFETGRKTEDMSEETDSVKHINRRITHEDLLECLGPEGQRKNTACYVCGPPKMTDEFVEIMGKAEGMEKRRVLCEKWW